MILPTKGLPPRQALLSLGADVLRVLVEPMTVSRLWHEVKKENERAGAVSFEWFVLSLDLLFVIDALEIDLDRVRKRLNNHLAMQS